MSYANFVQCQLAEAASEVADTIVLAPASAPFQLPPEDGGLLVLADSLGRPSQVEIIHYSARAGLSLTGVERAQEGTTGRDWPIGSYCYQALTAGQYARDASVGKFNPVDVTEDMVVRPLDFAQFKATGVALTITPQDFSEGQLLMIGNLTERLDHQVVLAKVNGQATDGHLVINKAMAVVTLKYVSADYGWSIL
ncbi:hypothetical protein ACT048_20715 [Ectopseudomonas khazarica]|uniref:hypothetical protein n=1 Tax=Ectopseudomonas khazarica TaxID=2502979 RepID=UPI004034180E